MPIHITFSKDIVVSRVLNQTSKVGRDTEVVIVKEGRHEFVLTSNPFTQIRTDKRYSDERFHNSWLVLPNTLDGLSVLAFMVMMSQKDCIVEGLPAKEMDAVKEFFARPPKKDNDE